VEETFIVNTHPSTEPIKKKISWSFFKCSLREEGESESNEGESGEAAGEVALWTVLIGQNGGANSVIDLLDYNW
jgi:hypothetical protein